MDLTWILAVSVALGADAFSFAVALGLARVNKRSGLWLAAVVAIFHVIMPLTGLWLGQSLGHYFGQITEKIGALVLIWLGARMLFKVLKPEQERYSFAEGRRVLAGGNGLSKTASIEGFAVVAVAFSVSLDALSVGFSLGTVNTPIGVTVFTMGLVAGTMTFLGLTLGRSVGARIGDKAEALGGIILVIIGLRLMV